MSLFELFFVFFKIGLFSFGGGYGMIPLINSELLSRGVISEQALIDFIGVAESTPGPFAVNIATFVGSSIYHSLRGWNPCRSSITLSKSYSDSNHYF